MRQESRRASLLIAIVLLIACAPDPDGSSPPEVTPPATGETTRSQKDPLAELAEPTGGLLDRVRVGQRYHFHMNQSGSEMDMVWKVTAITETEVRYDVTVFKNGVTVSAPSPATWAIPSKGSSAPKDTATAKVTRETITVANQPWSCRVTTTGEGSTWVPVHGERVSFPPLLKQTKGEIVSTVLTKIESP